MGWTFYNSSGQRLSSAATNISVLDIDGATDIGAAIVDADLFIVDDGAGGTNRKTAASRLKTYIDPQVVVWCQVQADGSSLDSYNVTSTAKDSTGIYTVTIADDLTGTGYAGAASSNSSVCKVVNINSIGTGAYKTECTDVSESAVDTANTSIICGDVA